jgi:hypothetical protein
MYILNPLGKNYVGITLLFYSITVWETTTRQIKGEWKFQVASKIHFILAGLASNSCKASRNMKTLATQFYVSVFLFISSVGVSLHFICWCFSPILSIGVAGSFMCRCFSPFHDKIGEKHRQIKWRETPTDEMERNTNRCFMYWCFSPFHLSVFFSYFIYRCCWQFYVLVFLSISSVSVSLHFRKTPTDEMERNTDT